MPPYSFVKMSEEESLFSPSNNSSSKLLSNSKLDEDGWSVEEFLSPSEKKWKMLQKITQEELISTLFK